MPKKYSNKKLTIGLLSISLDFEFPILLWTGVQAKAKEADVNMICFAGAEIRSPDSFRNERNTIYDMISSQNVDGLIILPSITCGFMKIKDINEYFEKYRNIPMVSIGLHLEKIPSIIIDNKYGFKILIDHLIEVHNRRKFLYIGGPVNNFEAIERLNVFKEALNEHGIKINSKYITVGNFLFQPAYDIVRNLLNQKFDFDAIVVANDDMAMAAIRALEEKKIIIPDEVSVIGFDDINSAGSLITPLTTVRQPIYDMTEKAVNTLLKRIKGEKVNDLEIMKTEPIIRKSCGCLSGDINKISIIDLKTDKSGYQDFKKIKEIILKELKKDFPFVSRSLASYDLTIENFFKFIQNEITENDFITNFDKTLKKSILIFFDNSVWDRLFFLLRKKFLPFFLNKSEMIIKIEDLIHKVRLLINDILKRVEKSSYVQLSERTRALQRIMSELVNSFNVHNLLEKMATELPKIGIESCYLSLHSSKEKMFKEARLILAYNKNGRINLNKDGFVFQSEELFPRDLIRLEDRYDLIIESLVYEKEQLGFIVFELNPAEGILMTSMSDQIKSTIKASMLLQDTLEKDKKLEEALSELKKEHKELEEIYKRLKENQEKLIMSNKMASLGRLTAGIAHEMNTPLAVAKAYLSEIVDLINEYKISISNPDITIKDHNEISDEMINAVNLVDKSIGKVSNFIKSIKSQTREDNVKERIIFNAVDIIKESIILLGNILKQNKLSVEFNFSNSNISLFGLPGRFAQVITNLVTNAIDALKDKKNKKDKTIKINLIENKSDIILKIEDKGIGIPNSIIKKIFDPLFTTKPFGHGTGLGLAIVNEIIYGEFNGSIEVESKVDYGTTFTIVFKKPENNKRVKKL